MIKHIIFDLGNVLVQIHPERTVAALAGECGKPFSALQSLFLSRIHDDLMEGKLTPQQFHERFMAEYGCRISYPCFLAHWESLIGDFKPGIAEVVSQLAPRFTLSVCSNTDPLHWELVCRNGTFLRQFHHYFLSYELKCLKPNSLMFTRMLENLGTKGRECIFIDDTAENIRAAETLGIHGIHASDTPAIVQGLQRLGVEVEISGPARG